MSTQVTLNLPDPVYQQAQKIAQTTQRDVDEVLTEALARTFQPFPINENRPAMLREVEAYKAMHPQLVKHYLGQYVAVHQGQVVDHDADPIVLLTRVKVEYLNQVVLRRKVEEQSETVLYFRSPRIVDNK